MISKITSEKEQAKFDYEGFQIISESLDNKLTKADLIKALEIMWKLVMEMDKDTRDEQYLFSKGLMQFNEVFKVKSAADGFTMEQAQQDKLKTKIDNLKPLVDFLLKMKDVIK
tara:strand:+ start:3606 stop:3944 length:339 start_codon:yes stop_codon:yes gene_type:complete